MQYVYAALLLHSGGKPVEEHAVSKVLESAGAKPDSAKGTYIKSIVVKATMSPGIKVDPLKLRELKAA